MTVLSLTKQHASALYTEMAHLVSSPSSSCCCTAKTSESTGMKLDTQIAI